MNFHAEVSISSLITNVEETARDYLMSWECCRVVCWFCSQETRNTKAARRVYFAFAGGGTIGGRWDFPILSNVRRYHH